MKILFCSEFFFPSIGGAQEVVKQLSVRFSKAGHTVEVATTYLDNRKKNYYHGIKINSFRISGNYSNGINGDTSSYINFVLNSNFDLIFIYAAQQWTLDCLIGLLDKVKAKKVFVPCGFSGLYLDQFKNYFTIMPSVLDQFDHLIFHSKNYRDYKFAKNNSKTPVTLIPNAADNNEFKILKNGFRKKYNISSEEFVLLTVGSLTGSKGHLEVAKSFSLLNSKKNLVLILNGNRLNSPDFNINNIFNYIICFFSANILKKIVIKYINTLKHLFVTEKSYFSELNKLVNDINSGKHGRNKRVILFDLDRSDLISCYFESDLFVFASNIEYSPLVLFEACAAGLPFITVDVGNSVEIVKWTKGGVICPSFQLPNGNTFVSYDVLSKNIDKLISNKSLLISLGKEGRNSWEEKFNWDFVTRYYEKIFYELCNVKGSESS